jgi:hypothetical protein
MKPYSLVRTRRHQLAGITSVDCPVAVFLPMILAAVVLPDFSPIISPVVQKVILATLIWPVLSFFAAGSRENK